MSGCWLWLGATNPLGYGMIDRNRYTEQLAHRYFFKVHRGDIPSGMFVCHRCDTPSCVNPDHLFLGTHEANMKDMVTKGRGRWPGPQRIFVEHEGQQICITHLERKLGWEEDTIAKRLRRGWSIERAISVDPKWRSRARRP